MELYERHYNYDQRIFGDDSLVKDQALLKKKMSEKVKDEIRRVKAFVKLRVYEGKYLYAEIKTKHRIEGLVLKELIKKYPNFTVVLTSPRGNFIMSKRELPFPIKNGVYFSEEDPSSVLNRLPTKESLLKFERRQGYWDRERSRNFYRAKNHQSKRRAAMRRAHRSHRTPRAVPPAGLMTNLLDFTFK